MLLSNININVFSKILGNIESISLLLEIKLLVNVIHYFLFRDILALYYFQLRDILALYYFQFRDFCLIFSFQKRIILDKKGEENEKKNLRSTC